MADVARLADVSTATVSNYLSGREDLLRRVSPQVQQRVADAVRSLGYVHNKTARHLRLQRTERICVLLPRLGNPYADQIAKDIDLVARGRGYTAVVVAGESLDIWRRVLREVEAGLADAVVCDADSLIEAELDELFGSGSRSTKARLVLHPNAAPNGFSVVNYDRAEALGAALDYIRTAGRKRLVYLENASPRSNARQELVRRFTSDPANGIDLISVFPGANSRKTAAEAMTKIDVRGNRIDTIICESDFSAVTVVEELQRLGLRVPDDVAVIGCGNAEEGQFAYPRLTTIGPRSISLTEATEHLIDRIERPAETEPRRFLLHWELIRRQSA